jgi:hypothetical protein
MSYSRILSHTRKTEKIKASLPDIRPVCESTARMTAEEPFLIPSPCGFPPSGQPVSGAGHLRVDGTGHDGVTDNSLAFGLKNLRWPHGTGDCKPSRLYGCEKKYLRFRSYMAIAAPFQLPVVTLSKSKERGVA